MKTLTIQIGNSDDKLTQKEWSNFISDIGRELSHWGAGVHFFGVSHGCEKWQNACWVVQIEEVFVSSIESRMSFIGKKFQQDSVAFTVGNTKFV